MLAIQTIATAADAPVGSIWQTDLGAQWKVIEHITGETGLYVKLARIGRIDDTYVWHVSSLTQTTARRIG